MTPIGEINREFKDLSANMGTTSNIHIEATTSKYPENSDLRKPPIYNERAFHLAYAHQTAPAKQTSELDIGVQAKMISAALKAYQEGCPINAILTLRWKSLLGWEDCHPLKAMTTPERIKHLVEKLRHWLTSRSVPAHYIWVRESPHDEENDHWHIGLHLPPKKNKCFIKYLESILVEPLPSKPRPRSKRTTGELACSEHGSWHLASDIADGKPQFTGYWIAAYLGKGEPSQRMFRGKLVNNNLKTERGQCYGGTQPHGRYDTPQGLVIGTATRKGRFDLSKGLK